MLIILLAALVSLVWFRDGCLFAGTDLVFPSDRLNIFLETFTIWDSRSLGFVNPRMLAWSFPNGAFLGISEVIGLSLEYAERLWFYLLFAFSGLSMYVLSSVVAKNKVKHYHAVGVIASLFYMFNPFLALGVSHWPYLWLTYASLPLMLGLFIKGLNEQHGLKYVLIINLVWLFLSASQFVNPKYAIIVWVPLLFYLAFHLIANREKTVFLYSCKFFLMLLTVWVLINFYWLLPNMPYIFQSVSVTGDLYLAIGRTRFADFALNSASLPAAMRLVGSWFLDSGFRGYPYVYWAQLYNSTLFILIGYLIPAIAFFPIIFKKNKNIVFFSLFLLGALVLMTGSQPPFGPLNSFLANIPFMLEVFNLPNILFGIYSVMAYAVLFGLGTIMLTYYVSKKLPRHLPQKLRSGLKYVFVGTVIFLVIGLYGFPLWTGAVAYPGNDLLASSNYQIPEYYPAASAWLSSDTDDFRLFPMPYSKAGYVAYTWPPGGYQGPDLTESLLGKPLVAEPINSDLGVSIAHSIVSNSTDNAAKLLAFMNVKYIILHNDVNWKLIDNYNDQIMYSYITTTQKNLTHTLNSMTGFSYCRSFGQLDFYLNTYWTPMKIYATSNALYCEDFEQLTESSEHNQFIPNQMVILPNTHLNIEQTPNPPTNSTITADPDLTSNNPITPVLLTYEKLNPTLYNIYVNTSSPFFLVFSDSYDKDWVATVDGHQLSDNYHFNANGFANGWYINKTGTYTIVLEFQPQKLFYTGVAISLTTLLVCTIYLGRHKLKKQIEKIYHKNTNLPITITH